MINELINKLLSYQIVTSKLQVKSFTLEAYAILCETCAVQDLQIPSEGNKQMQPLL